jgi:hypothetical protein
MVFSPIEHALYTCHVVITGRKRIRDLNWEVK